MNYAKDLIQLNNKKRKQLTKENLKYYENILVYIRLSYSKNEQETEEILSDLLNHLLEAQAEGKTAEEVFGDEPKQYADEIIGELPGMLTKKRTLFITMFILYFLATYTISSGAFVLILYYVFNLGELIREIYIGSVLIQTLILVPITLFLGYILIQYIRWSCFKQINKVAEFLLLGISGIVSFGMYRAVFYFVPKFSPIVEMPIYATLPLGIILFLAAHMTRRVI